MLSPVQVYRSGLPYGPSTVPRSTPLMRTSPRAGTRRLAVLQHVVNGLVVERQAAGDPQLDGLAVDGRGVPGRAARVAGGGTVRPEPVDRTLSGEPHVAHARYQQHLLVRGLLPGTDDARVDGRGRRGRRGGRHGAVA